MRALTIAVVITGTLALGASGAEKGVQLPKDLPAYGPLKPSPAPPVTQFKLDNGLTVWLVPMPGFPKVDFTLTVKGGYTADPDGRPGLADLLAATVTQGTRRRNAKQIAEEMQLAGGDLGAEAEADLIRLETTVLGANAPAALELLADVAANAAFADSEVDLAKRNAVSSLDAAEAQPGFLGHRALYRALFAGHPYAITSPTRESINATTAAELRSEFAKRFQPGASILVAVGDFDPANLSAAIRTSWAGWHAGSGMERVPEKPKASVSRAVVYVPRDNSVQTGFYMGALGPDRAAADFASARVANAIYGGMFGSRLINNIREDKGYTYSPRAQLSALRQTGVLVTQAEVRNAVTGASFNEISYELNRIATTELAQDELDHAKRYLIGSQAIRLQSRGAISRTLGELWVDALPPEELGKLSEKIEAVNTKEAEAAARKYFPAWRMTIVAVGDEKVIKDELAPFGLEFQKAE